MRMKGWVLAAYTGAVFGLGLVVSGMTSPARVTAFLDVGGHWDPTLAFVMGAAILVHGPLVRLARRRTHPALDPRFHGPARHGSTGCLVAGAALFGVGWGLSGYCPGPALVSLVGAAPSSIVFVAALVAGTMLGRAWISRHPDRGGAATETSTVAGDESIV